MEMNVKMNAVEAFNEINKIGVYSRTLNAFANEEIDEMDNSIYDHVIALLKNYEILLTGLLNNMVIYNFTINTPDDVSKEMNNEK